MAARFGVAVFVLALALLAGSAQAQEYQRLHVRSFTLSSDISHPQLEQPFHVTVAIRVAENVPQVRNVFLPTFFGAEELGDAQQIVHGPGGTVYRETLTLVAHTSGTLSITSAYLDAIDARDGKPKRFISNPLNLQVGGGPTASIWNALRVLAFVVIGVLILVVALIAAAVGWLRSQIARTPEPLAQPPPQPVQAPMPKDELGDALQELRSRRDRPSVLQLRAILWKMMGSSSGETLSDVLQRPKAREPNVRKLLTSVERAAFIEDSRLSDAIDEVIEQREWTFA